MYGFEYNFDEGEDDDFDNFEDSTTEIGSMPSQCGMRTIIELDDCDDLETQIKHLENAFNDSENGGTAGASQVIITDVVAAEKDCWKETKAHSYHGPITINPNTKNRIKLYICTKETLKELKALVKKPKKKAAKKK